MMITVTERVLAVCRAVEDNAATSVHLGILFSPEENCWHLIDREGCVVAKLSGDVKFFGPPGEIKGEEADAAEGMAPGVQ